MNLRLNLSISFLKDPIENFSWYYNESRDECGKMDTLILIRHVGIACNHSTQKKEAGQLGWTRGTSTLALATELVWAT